MKNKLFWILPLLGVLILFALPFEVSAQADPCQGLTGIALSTCQQQAGIAQPTAEPTTAAPVVDPTVESAATTDSSTEEVADEATATPEAEWTVSLSLIEASENSLKISWSTTAGQEVFVRAWEATPQCGSRSTQPVGETNEPPRFGWGTTGEITIRRLPSDCSVWVGVEVWDRNNSSFVGGAEFQTLEDPDEKNSEPIGFSFPWTGIFGGLIVCLLVVIAGALGVSSREPNNNDGDDDWGLDPAPSRGRGRRRSNRRS